MSSNNSIFSQIDDKNADIQEYQNRLEEIQRNSLQNHEIETKLRKEIELLAMKNGELESKLSEVASTVCFTNLIQMLYRTKD